ncbi:hypothetical protein C2134_02185 [Chromobacterium sinusclupearum]|uniref:Uncharacterized protein n=1 Tax=Chromobacterium sinusclupearum TaxID=2077146 RepID=A0A2K4MT76_9NEIS|nr:hypothetical protein C2134_02185 [Chromobacterium sinusclupearum]
MAADGWRSLSNSHQHFATVARRSRLIAERPPSAWLLIVVLFRTLWFAYTAAITKMVRRGREEGQ